METMFVSLIQSLIIKNKVKRRKIFRKCFLKNGQLKYYNIIDLVYKKREQLKFKDLILKINGNIYNK